MGVGINSVGVMYTAAALLALSPGRKDGRKEGRIEGGRRNGKRRRDERRKLGGPAELREDKHCFGRRIASRRCWAHRISQLAEVARLPGL